MKFISVEKRRDIILGTFLWNDISFVCEISGFLSPEPVGKISGALDFDTVVSCKALSTDHSLGLCRSVDVCEVEICAQVKHLLPAGDGQGIFSLDIGLQDMYLYLDTGETQGLLLEVGECISLLLRGVRFTPYLG